MTPQTTPVRLDLKRDEKLVIEWQDGVTCEYSVSTLRTMCPCAQCKMVREGTDPHDISPTVKKKPLLLKLLAVLRDFFLFQTSLHLLSPPSRQLLPFQLSPFRLNQLLPFQLSPYRLNQLLPFQLSPFPLNQLLPFQLSH